MPPVLSITDLTVGFSQPGRNICAVRQVSLAVAERECVGIVGESGSGKTQIFMAAMGLLAGNGRAEGSVRFGEEDLLGLGRERLNRIRGAKLSMVFQDPMTSLTPHLKIGTQLAEVLVCHAGKSWRESRLAARRMLERVGVPEPARRLNQYPHELSGGLRQRVMIGMSLLCDPLLMIADEPTTALDTTVQAQVIDLLRAMRGEFGMAMVLISHDLAVVAALCDRILVMYSGRIVESASTLELFHHARHPYTAELLKCIPSLSGPRLERLPTLPGQPPQAGEALEGCAFAPRCARAAARCWAERPPLGVLGAAGERDPVSLGVQANARGEARRVACHFPLPP